MAASRTSSWLQRLVLASPVLWVLAIGWRYRFMTEDAFIYLRVVRQLEAGNGPVFNAGERVEVYTGTLWLGLLTVTDIVLPFRLEWLAVVGGLLLTGLGVALAIAGSMRVWGRGDAQQWFVPVGALVFVATPPVWAFATSGLENGLAFAWVGSCLLVLARWADAPEASRADTIGRPSAVLLGLGWLIRPELVLLSATLLVAVVVADRRSLDRRRVLGLAAAATAAPIAYQIFRMGYFGSIVPNTGIAKEGSELTVQRGIRYFRDFVEPTLLLLPVAALVAGALWPMVQRARRAGDRRRVAAAVAMVVGASANIAYVVAVGGDYHHGRLFLPALLALVAPVAVVPVARRHVVALAAAAWAVVVVLAHEPEAYRERTLADGFIMIEPNPVVVSEDAGGEAIHRLERRLDQDGTVVESGPASFTAVAFPLDPDVPVPLAILRGIGVTGYASGTHVHILDVMGLADTFTAHLERHPPGDRRLPAPGHEKPLPSPWIVARLAHPDAVVDEDPFPQLPSHLLPADAADAAGFAEQVAWARAALRCPEIVELLDAARAELTPRRVLDNIVGSISNSRLRIPPDPEAAYRRFCGESTPPEVSAIRGGGR
jgi:arabinofuranosyltransferase